MSSCENQGGCHGSPNARYLKRNETSFRIVVTDAMDIITGAETSSPSLYSKWWTINAYVKQNDHSRSHCVPWMIPFFARSWTFRGGILGTANTRGLIAWNITCSTSTTISPRLAVAGPKVLSSSEAIARQLGSSNKRNLLPVSWHLEKT